MSVVVRLAQGSTLAWLSRPLLSKRGGEGKGGFRMTSETLRLVGGIQAEGFSVEEIPQIFQGELFICSTSVPTYGRVPHPGSSSLWTVSNMLNENQDDNNIQLNQTEWMRDSIKQRWSVREEHVKAICKQYYNQQVRAGLVLQQLIKNQTHNIKPASMECL